MNDAQSPKKIAASEIEPIVGSVFYPKGLREICDGREKRVLGNPFGLTQFGVNLTMLPPGVSSAQRHWHEAEDEFVYVVSGTLTLVTDAGETVLEAGECAGFPAGTQDGHMLVNRSSEPASFLEIGSRAKRETVHYPDVDMHIEIAEGRASVTRKDGSGFG